MSTRRSHFRARLAAQGALAAPGAYDAFTARIVERAGFEAIYLGGNALGLGLAKGQPFVTLTETVEATTRVTRAVGIPVIVDAGAGFGEPAHVAVAVRELEAAGAAALHIDDQPYPKQPRYHRGEGVLASLEEVVAKLHAALQARRDPDLLIIARTDALRVTRSLEETITRARVLAAAGADAILPLDLSPAQAREVKAALPTTPLAWIGGVTAPIPTLEQIGAGGFSLALYPFNTVAAVSAAVSELWAGLQATGSVDQPAALLARARSDSLEIVHMQDAFEVEAAARSGGES